MKKNPTLLMLAIAAMAAFSCTKEMGTPELNTFDPKIVTAVVDGNITKTHLDGVTVLWTEGDKITAFDDAGTNYSSNAAKIEDGNKLATFEFPEFPAEKELVYAIYPEDGDAHVEGDKVVMQLSSEQPALANSFSEGANLAIAKGDGTDQLQFKNVGAYLSLTIKNDDVTHIKLTSSSNMTGEATVDWNDGKPVAVVSPDGSSEVLMDDIQGAGTYYFVVYPGRYEDLKIVFTKDDGQKAIYTNSKELVLERNDNLFIGEFDIPEDKWITAENSFTVRSADVVSNSGYETYTKTISNTISDTDWIITFGGNNKSIGTNSGSRTNCNLSSYPKYAVSPVATNDVATVFANTTPISDVTKIQYAFNGGSYQTNTKVYLLYSEDNETFSQIDLTSGEQGAAISTGTTFEFAECSGYFAVLFVATNTSGNWRIDDVELTFTYTDETGGGNTEPEQPNDGKTITFDLSSSYTNVNSSSYVTNATEFVVNNITFEVNNWNPSSGQVRGNQGNASSINSSNFQLCNKTPLPGKIRSIVFKTENVVSTYTYAKFGTSLISSCSTSDEQATAGDGSVSWTRTGDETFFFIGMAKGGTTNTAKITEITIICE
ncbi:MAG: hypothetical protein J1D85_06390 [Bacteroidales bacterium]|nr:hypothetical protein [Bacteroidales bacterium]